MFRLIYIFIFIFSSLLAKENQIFWDGRDWNKINKSAGFNENHEYKIKSAYINGVLDGRLYGYLKTWNENPSLANEVFGESVDYLTVREIIKNLNYFYEDPLNSYIPIPSAIIIANMYGKRLPLSLIDQYTKDSRDWINSLIIELDTLDYSKIIEEKYFNNQKVE